MLPDFVSFFSNQDLTLSGGTHTAIFLHSSISLAFLRSFQYLDTRPVHQER